MRTYNERTGIELEAVFEDADERPAVPATVHWRMDCETTRTALKDWTSIGHTVTTDGFGNTTKVSAVIDVQGSLNAIQNTSNAKELKTILVVTGKDTDREVSEEFSYYVRNTRGRS